MRCGNCGTDNREGRRFCAECGGALNTHCARCGASNEPGEKFCGQCGAALAVDSGATPTIGAAPAIAAVSAISLTAEPSVGDIPEGERKTVTALFADIKGSTELMADLDPEEARAIVDPALKLMIDAVHRYDGYIVQSTGDGVFALFGAPAAHEDHPQRALYAAVRMQEELRRYAARLRAQGGVPVEARIGANTGEVVVRSIRTEGHAEYMPIGHTTNLASRMQVVAPTGSIAISEATRKLCEGYFLLKALGPTVVKGLAEPVNVYEVTGLGPLRTRLQRAVGRGLTRFVGREAELAQMRRALEMAREGHGQVVAAMGDPGVGKSRLFFEFKAVAQSGCLVLEAYSVSHGKASAYLPVIDLLKSYFEIMPEDDERKRREKVAGKVVILDRTLEDTLPYLYSLLGISENDDPLAALDQQTRRRRTLEAIKRILVRESLSQPLIVEFEDLHWIDSETQALLNLLVDGIATARIVLLVNYRPEYHHQWGSKTYYTQLRLDPLGKESAGELLSALLASPAPAAEAAGANRERSLADVHVGERVRAQDGIAALKRLIIERTEGNPFFMEEMVQSLIEQGVLARDGVMKLAKPLDEIRVPPTVQAILASRIDRLPAAEKELLQTLAVLGREFSAGLIKQVAGKSDDELERMLAALQLAEFIYEQPAMGDVEYTFKHALTLEVGYNSVLAQRRRLLHERAAQGIEALFSDRLEDHLGELAHHYDRSGNECKAVEYLGRAGRLAAQQMAHSEAVGYLKRALELLKNLPGSAERDRQEFDLQMALDRSLHILHPFDPEREPALIRARELCEQLGEDTNQMEALLQLAHFRFLRREYGVARELAQRVVLGLAEPAKATAMVAGAHYLLGAIASFLGQLEAAREHLELAVALLGPGPLRNFGEAEYGQAATFHLTTTLLLLGYPEAARRKSREFLDAMRRLSDPFSLARALSLEVLSHARLRNTRTALQRAEELLVIATEHGMPFHAASAAFSRGWALADEGRGREGLAEMLRVLPAFEGLAATTGLYARLGDSYRKTGRPEEGLTTVATALRETERSAERTAEPELYTVKGELLLMRDPRDEAEAERCFRIAIDIARPQKARFFELRATTGLARLLNRRDKRDEARAMLSDIYGWFTEGFEFADLKDAKALLEELAQ
jgi:class 3 adenylate cyclase/tetratricopeptide (TPR) repeat protein